MPVNAMIGFGIIGCGNIGQIHAKAIGEIPNARLVAVADLDAASVEKLASAYPQARAYQK